MFDSVFWNNIRKRGKKNERASGRNLKTNRSIKSLLKMFINIFFIKLPSQTFGSVQLFGLDGFIDVNLTLGIHNFFFFKGWRVG